MPKYITIKLTLDECDELLDLINDHGDSMLAELYESIVSRLESELRS